MRNAVALITNACEFAGPPAVQALHAAGFQVLVHDVAFRDPVTAEQYRAEHPQVIVLAAQTPGEIIADAWAVAERLDVLVSNDAYTPIHTPIATADVADLRATLERLVVFPFALAQAAIPKLTSQPTARVVMITQHLCAHTNAERRSRGRLIARDDQGPGRHLIVPARIRLLIRESAH